MSTPGPPYGPYHPPVPSPSPYTPNPYQPFQPVPAKKNRSRMKRIGKWMTWIGAIILVACVATGIVLAVIGFSKIAGQADDIFAIDTTTTRTFSDGDSLQLFAPEDSVTPTCTFDGPADVTGGSEVSTNFGYDGQQIESFRTVEIKASGSYTITCDRPAYAAPALSAGEIAMSVVGILLAVFGGGFGFILTVVGIVLWVVGARSASA
ncbi:hypothetical protein [Gordonia sp. ABSL49_1]|uniref:hypothetical protein n=1 Tax=unclassified Gordonia (in: high G+C Gram-positive bacteria) TaxID=2657482 RepID=UPI001F0CE7BC|nr:hypothetical protein [Gordonia sp. ABSL49_1]MCH5641875.1 hypothetical protein [Gordonia sp. ABSL49_1]